MRTPITGRRHDPAWYAAVFFPHLARHIAVRLVTALLTSTLKSLPSK